ncbi:MAG TPA: methionyl-tRNA formyltransferase, partial [Rhodospirillum rubrum]|nr:methionyl-tRNA formyltransferase [Rhodospirillum rubrum]
MTLSVVFMGTPAFSVPILHALHNNPDLTLRAVYCQPPRAAGRGKKPRPTPVHAAAEALGIPVFTPARLRDAADQQAFAELAADVAVVAAYG